MDWKDQLKGMLPDDFKSEIQEKKDTVNHDKLVCGLQKKGRGGKTVTTVTGFTTYYDKEVTELSKQLKKHCGVGGSVDDKMIVIQGDQRDKVVVFLKKEGYNVVKSGA